MVKPVDWRGAITFEEYVIELFETKKTDTEEFKSLLRLRGRQRLEEIWKQYRAGNIQRRDPRNAAPNPVSPKGPEPENQTKAKAKSFVERSCPDDDFRMDE